MSTQPTQSTLERTFLTVNEVADIYRVSTRTVRRWVSDGRLPAQRVAGTRMWRIPAAVVDAEPPGTGASGGSCDSPNYEGET